MKQVYGAALLGGATVSLIPTWAVSTLAQKFPSIAPKELEIVSKFFGNGIGLTQMVVFAIIVFLLPQLEEWLFRGVLWNILENKVGVPGRFTWFTTSIIFAGIHLEPLHVLGLLPLSFFLGWLRLKDGSIGPSVVAHTTNNAVACLLMVL